MGGEYEDGDFVSRKEYYKGIINYEQILGSHITKMSIFRDTNLKQYCSSVETFILMTPKGIRAKCFLKLKEMGLIRGDYSTPNLKVLKYDDLWAFTNELLEKENLIFKSGVFETGHD